MTQGKLFERDWRSLLEAILRINSATDIALLQRISLECLLALVPSDQYAFFISRTGTREALGEPYIMGFEAKYLDKFMVGDYNTGEDAETFFSGRHILSHNTETSRDSDQIPEDYLVETRIYKEIYAPQGIHYGMRSSLMFRRKFVGSLELFNSKKRGDYTDKQLEIMTLLAPHIANRLGLLMDAESRSNSSPTLVPEEIKELFHLTDREAEIVSMLSTGAEDHTIINELYISGSTFKKHLYNAYKKMGVSSRTQLFNTLLAAKSNSAKKTKRPRPNGNLS